MILVIAISLFGRVIYLSIRGCPAALLHPPVGQTHEGHIPLSWLHPSIARGEQVQASSCFPPKGNRARGWKRFRGSSGFRSEDEGGKYARREQNQEGHFWGHHASWQKKTLATTGHWRWPRVQVSEGSQGVTVRRLLGWPAARYPDVSVPKYNYTQPYLWHLRLLAVPSFCCHSVSPL